MVAVRLRAIEQIPADDGAFRLIFTRDILGHIEDLERALVECRRVLSANGFMVIFEVFATPMLEPDKARRLCADSATVAERIGPRWWSTSTPPHSPTRLPPPNRRGPVVQQRRPPPPVLRRPRRNRHRPRQPGHPCGFHHRSIHEHGWRISGDPNRDLAWIRPDGTIYHPHRTRLQKLFLNNSATQLHKTRLRQQE